MNAIEKKNEINAQNETNNNNLFETEKKFSRMCQENRENNKYFGYATR